MIMKCVKILYTSITTTTIIIPWFITFNTTHSYDQFSIISHTNTTINMIYNVVLRI